MPVPWKSTIRRQESSYERPSQDVLNKFQSFYEATSFQEATQAFACVLNNLQLEPGPFQIFFPKLKNRLQRHLPYKFQTIWGVLEKKSKLDVYGHGIASCYNVLVVGAGPCGLKTAIETQFLGAQTVVVEKREDFTRNNVLKLWKFLLEDLKSLGIKNLYGQFATGEVNHIGIKTLQLVLSKICLLIGVKIVVPVTFMGLSNPNASGKQWTATFLPENHDVNNYTFNMIVIASGKNVPASIHNDFGRHSLGAKLSIAVTANFVNNRSKDEQSVEQIPGLSKQYNQQFFANIEKEKGISLENIVYYKGETHYFVMTATRNSLLSRGVLRENKVDRDELMSSSNINKEEMYRFAIDAAEFSTNALSHKLPTTEFSLDSSGKPDVSVFDFTDLYCASNASRVKFIEHHKLIMASVGDSLLQPFWPEGTGCARGFLSAMNAAWMLKRYAEGRKTMQIIAERENLYKLLKQTSDGPGSVLKDDHQLYTLNPKTRYKQISQKVDHRKLNALYEKTGASEPFKPAEPDETDQPTAPSAVTRVKKQTLKKLGNLVKFPQKAQRARHRKTVLRASGDKSHPNIPTNQQKQKDDKEQPNTVQNTTLPPVSSVSPSNKFESSGIGVLEEFVDERMKNKDDGNDRGNNRVITPSNAKTAMETLKAYADQEGIENFMLLEFEKIITNSLPVQ